MARTTSLRTASLLAALAAGVSILFGLAVGGGLPDGDELWTLVLLLLSLVLPIWCCFGRTWRDGGPSVDVFQPGTVLAILFYVYTVIPAFHVWRDLRYQSDWTDATWPPGPLYRFTLFLSLLSLIAFRIGYVRRPARRQEQLGPAVADDPGALWPRSATVTALLMLAIGLPFVLRHLTAFGGLTSNLLLFLSPSYTVESGIKIGGVPTFLEGCFNWGALLLLYRAMLTGRQKLLSVAVVAVAFVLAYLLSGKRSAIFPFLLYPLVWYHYMRRRLTVQRASLYLAVGLTLMTVLLLMRTVGPVLATGGFRLAAVPSDILYGPWQFFINSPDLAGFDMTVMAVQDRPTLLHEVGGPFWGALKYNLVGALYVIPRALWPGKPVYTDIGTFFFQHAGGNETEVGFAMGIVGGLYLFGGVLGVLIGMMGIGALLRLVYERLQPWSRNPRRVMLHGIFLWMTFHLFRFGELGGTFAYFYQFELAGVVAIVLALKGPRPHTASRTALVTC